MPKPPQHKKPINRQSEPVRHSSQTFSEIDQRGLQSLNRLDEIAALPHDAPTTSRPIPEVEGTFLVDKYVDAIPFTKDVDRERKLTSVRYAVCIARDRANSKIGQHRGFIEAKLKLRRIAKYLDDNRLKIIGDPVTQLYLAIDITETLKHIDRYERLLPEEGAKTAKTNQSTKKSNYQREVTNQIRNLESGMAQSRVLISLSRNLLSASGLGSGTKMRLQQRTFISEIVGWWRRNTGNWPPKSYKSSRTGAVDGGTIDFYNFLEAARRDAGYTKVSPSSAGESGPFERMARDVVTELKPPTESPAQNRKSAQRR